MFQLLQYADKKNSVIQIPELKKRRRNVLEQVLSIFEQTEDAGPAHILSIREEDYPEAYREVIRRLQKAASEPDVRETMDIEDDILEELGDLERLVEEQGKALEEQGKALEEKDKALLRAIHALVDKGMSETEARKLLVG